MAASVIKSYLTHTGRTPQNYLLWRRVQSRRYFIKILIFLILKLFFLTKFIVKNNNNNIN